MKIPQCRSESWIEQSALSRDRGRRTRRPRRRGLETAQQPGQLGDVRFLYPALAVRALPVRASIIGAALTDLPALVHGDLPGGLLPLAQLLAHRVDQLVAGRDAGGSAVIPASSTDGWSGLTEIPPRCFTMTR